jgi:hypothetical protein
VTAVAELADRVGAATAVASLAEASRPGVPTGALTAQTVAEAVGATLVAETVVVDEAQTGGIWASPATAGCPPHDWLTLTGGSITRPGKTRTNPLDLRLDQTEHAVRIFDVNADADVAPLRVMKGAATGLRFPAGMLVATTGG